MNEVSSSSTTVRQRDQADQIHAHELKRLRQDVETLYGEKEQLRQQLQDQDRERQELQDNFLYVKDQLEKMQMRQCQDAEDAAGAPARELQRHRQTLDKASEERKLLYGRLEAALRDAEKDKAYHEQSL